MQFENLMPVARLGTNKTRNAKEYCRSVEVWPAAGGGILVGIAEPSLSGSARNRNVIKTAFIKLDDRGGITLTIPYVMLEAEAQACAAALAADELCVPDDCIEIVDSRRVELPVLVDLAPSVEGALRMCAAAAATRLIAAAARRWNTARSRCNLAEGFVVNGKRKVSYQQLACDAALIRTGRTENQGKIISRYGSTDTRSRDLS